MALYYSSDREAEREAKTKVLAGFMSLMNGVKNIILVKLPKNVMIILLLIIIMNYDHYYCYDDDNDDDDDDDVESILHDFTFPRVPPGEETTQSLTHLIIILSDHHHHHHHHHTHSPDYNL